MINLRERRRQLLNLTITEIILILLFLVLLVTASLIKKNQKLNNEIADYKSLDLDQAQLAEFVKFKDVIKDLKEKNGEFAEMDLEEIVNDLVLAREEYKKIKDKESEIATLTNKLKDYDKDKEELAFYKDKYGNDKPPC